MKVVEIAFSVYGVSDVTRARQFYEDILGLTATKTFVKGKVGMIEYEIGAGALAIGAGVPLFKPASAGGVVALEVEDFPAAVQRLRERGVKFVSEPHETPVCHLVTIADPDGNLLMIHKRKTA
jgi:predicted enzyme related to lactoylglutathione lyase